MGSTPPEHLRLRPARRRSLLLLAAGLLLLLLGGAGPSLLRWPAIAAGSASVALGLARLRSSARVALVLTPEGLEQHDSHGRRRFHAWTEVSEVRLWSMSLPGLDEQTHVLLKTSRGDVLLGEGLDCEARELLQLVRAFWQREHSSSALPSRAPRSDRLRKKSPHPA